MGKSTNEAAALTSMIAKGAAGFIFGGGDVADAGTSGKIAPRGTKEKFRDAFASMSPSFSKYRANEANIQQGNLASQAYATQTTVNAQKAQIEYEKMTTPFDMDRMIGSNLPQSFKQKFMDVVNLNTESNVYGVTTPEAFAKALPKMAGQLSDVLAESQESMKRSLAGLTAKIDADINNMYVKGQMPVHYTRQDFHENQSLMRTYPKIGAMIMEESQALQGLDKISGAQKMFRDRAEVENRYNTVFSPEFKGRLSEAFDILADIERGRETTIKKDDVRLILIEEFPGLTNVINSIFSKGESLEDMVKNTLKSKVYEAMQK